MVIIVAFAPYAVFHLLFQETVTTRYALPLVPALAYLAVTWPVAPAPVGRTDPRGRLLALLFCVHDGAGHGNLRPRRRPGGPGAG